MGVRGKATLLYDPVVADARYDGERILLESRGLFFYGSEYSLPDTHRACV